MYVSMTAASIKFYSYLHSPNRDCLEFDSYRLKYLKIGLQMEIEPVYWGWHPRLAQSVFDIKLQNIGLLLLSK